MLPDLVLRLDDLRRLAERGLGLLVDLAIRLVIAQVFIVSGVIKIANWDTALYLSMHEYPVPWLDAGTAALLGLSIELGAGLLLAVGLFARPAALALAALSLVIQFYYKELPEHLFWAILCVWIVVRGAGPLSLDGLIAPQGSRLPIPGATALRGLLHGLDGGVAPFHQLFLRVWMAEIFWTSGLTKLASWDTTILLFAEEYKVPLLPPELAALLGTATELAMPVLLAAGFATRLAALPLIIMTLVIQFTYLDKMEHWLWVLALAILVTRGAGTFSLDWLLGKFLRRRFPALDGRPAADPATAPRVVIVGAGFGGLSAAKALRHAPASVTVIDRRNYHLFQPLLYQVATAGLSPADIATPIREVLRDQPNARVLLGRVEGIDKANRRVQMRGGGGVPYDYLILATGARHGYFGHDEWEAVAPGLKKIDDATAIRARILSAFERAEVTQSEVERRRLLTFVLVGAGPTGVELAGAIAELAHFGMERDFRNFDPATARVLLVQAADRVLPVFPAELSASAKSQLEELGVEVLLDARVEAIDDQGVQVNGARIPAGTVLWTAGVVASPAAKWLGLTGDAAGRVPVAADLSVAGQPDVFVVGDTAAMRDADGKPVPGLAPAAKQSGIYAARVIMARLAGRAAPPPFHYDHLGSMATIGRKAAIADFGWLRLSGLPAWWLWGVVHVAFLVGARNRVAVLLDWFWSYLTLRRGIRLITGGEN